MGHLWLCALHVLFIFLSIRLDFSFFFFSSNKINSARQLGSYLVEEDKTIKQITCICKSTCDRIRPIEGKDEEKKTLTQNEGICRVHIYLYSSLCFLCVNKRAKR